MWKSLFAYKTQKEYNICIISYIIYKNLKNYGKIH